MVIIRNFIIPVTHRIRFNRMFNFNCSPPGLNFYNVLINPSFTNGNFDGNLCNDEFMVYNSNQNLNTDGSYQWNV